MSAAASAVTHAVELELIGAEVTSTIGAELRYDPADPFAVTVRFHAPDSPVAWTFGRDLLGGGLYAPTGDGDVHVRPSVDWQGVAVVLLELHSPHGDVLVQADSRQVTYFLRQVESAVPTGTEEQHLDLDTAVAVLLGEYPAV